MKYLFFTFLFLASCAPTQIHYIGNDKGLKALHNAANQWENVCHQDILVSRDYGEIPVREVKDIHKEYPALPKYVTSTTIIRNGKPYMIVFEVPKGATEQELTGLLAHELGHILGIYNHSESGLMMDDANRKVDPNKPTDLAEVNVMPNDCKLLPGHTK